MKPTKSKSEEQEQPKDLDDFEQFVKAIWSVPKEELEEQIQKDQEKLVGLPEEKKHSPAKKTYFKK